MGGLPLDNVSEGKDLGLTVKKTLKPSQQCNIAAAKASRIFGIIKKTFPWRDGVELTELY